MILIKAHHTHAHRYNYIYILHSPLPRRDTLCANIQKGCSNKTEKVHLKIVSTIKVGPANNSKDKSQVISSMSL